MDLRRQSRRRSSRRWRESPQETRLRNQSAQAAPEQARWAGPVAPEPWPLPFPACPPQQHWRTFVLVHTARYRWHCLLRCLGLNSNSPSAMCLRPSIRLHLPLSFADAAGHRKQSQGNSGAHRFINRLAPQRHGHRRSLVGAGIVVLAVDHDGDRNQARFAIRGQFEQTQGSRPFTRLWRACDLRRYSGRKRGLQKNGQREHAA